MLIEPCFKFISAAVLSSTFEWGSIELIYCPFKLLGNMELIHLCGIEAGQGIGS